jgi:TRAP-type C4-dicarboxylate transport system permease small subunit
MIRLAERIGVALTRVEAGLTGVADLLLLLLLVLINVEVVARYGFNTSTLIADEYGGYLFAWITMLGALHLLRSDKYLMMTWLVDKMSPRARNRVAIGSAVIGLAVSIVSLYASFVLVRSAWRFGTVSIQPSATPLVWPLLVLPVGYFVLVLAYLEEILRRCLGLAPRRDRDDIVRGGLD